MDNSVPEYVCTPPYCHLDLGSGVGATSFELSTLVDGVLIAIRFPVPSESDNSYQGMQLALSYYSTVPASSALLTGEGYKLLLQLYASGVVANTSLPSYAMLPRLRDFSFDNVRSTGIFNRQIPFGVLEQEIWGYGTFCVYCYPICSSGLLNVYESHAHSRYILDSTFKQATVPRSSSSSSSDPDSPRHPGRTRTRSR